MRMRSVLIMGIVLLLCLTGCATAGSGGAKGAALRSTHRSGSLRLGPVQMGGDLSFIGGVYRCDLGRDVN
jgi:hypothetical protein